MTTQRTMTEDRGKIRFSYDFDLAKFRVIRISDGRILFEDTMPGITIEEYQSLLDKYETLCQM